MLMPSDHILALLVEERDRLNRAIEALHGPAKRRARPQKNPLTAVQTPPAPIKKRVVSAASRRKMAAAQRKRWAAIKKAAAR
jgi:hypothetical protein